VTAALAGIVKDLDEATYFAHPALSSTGARRLLESPAKFRYMQDHPEPHKEAFSLGTAVHTKVLGVGHKVIEYPPEHLTPSGNASTKAATVEWVEEQRSSGLVVISAAQAELVKGMSEAVLAHPTARALFEQEGTAEASVFATDPATDVDLRARFDYLPDFTVDDPWTVDLKTTALSASPEGFARIVADHRYDIQQEWYLQTYAIVTGDFMARMKFVVVEKNAPYLVGVYQLATEFAEMARRKVQLALNLYAACAAADAWPGYPSSPDPLQPPTWLMFQEGAIA
jgi:hypothetical protein